VKQKVALGFELRGNEHLKNIAEPVRVYRVRLDRGGEAQRPALALPDKPSIAVLPCDYSRLAYAGASRC
jgi:adenylate cyclase